jgi:SRSO17 transposase
MADRARLPRLKTGLGLDHFEGRSYTGWHRQVTLAALA